MRKKLPNLEGLYLYTQVVKAGSFAQVCAQLKMPKPTLSRKIQQLEAELDIQLLVRTTRSVVPTEIGRAFYHRALLILSACDDAEALLDKTKLEPQGLLRISAGVEYGMAIVSPLISEFSKRFPKVNTELDLTGRHVDLAHEGFDLAIRIGPLPDSALFSRRLGSIVYGLYASPDYVANIPELNSPQDLEGHPGLVFTRGRNQESWRLYHGDREVTVATYPRICANNFWVLRTAAEDGLGVVFMPYILAHDALQSGRLLRLLPEWISAPKAIHVLYPEQRYLSPKVRAFIDFLAEKLSVDSVEKNHELEVNEFR